MAESVNSTSDSADAYLGSVISLISKSEIRYEGVLGGIDTEKCTIELHRVKSYGTEGRKRDGPQIAASDIEYAYVVFKGSDLKDLKVKSSPLVHAEQPMHEDPAIIKSHYAQAPSAQAVSIGGRSLTGVSSHEEPSALPRPVYPGALPSYQPREPMGSWGSATQNVDGVSLAMPMYSSEYYGSSSSLPHAQQQPVPFHPPSTMLGPSILQNQLHYPEVQVSSYLPSYISSSLSIKSPLPYLTPVPADSLTMTSLPLPNQHLNAVVTSFSDKSGSATIPGVPIQTSASSILGPTSGPSLTVSPALLTPDQLTQAEPPSPSSAHRLSPEENNLEVLVPTSSKLSAAVSNQPNQVPLLPLPHSSQQRQNCRPPFTEEFDFTAMNEKFKKDEVWGYLGKAKERNNAEGTEGNEIYQCEDGDSGHRKGPEFDVKSVQPVYVKDEFFDTLTSDSLSHRARNGGIKFSERMKLDTETFGSFQQPSLLGRGGHGFGRGGHGFGRGGYNRGSYNRGRGYNYGVRGRGATGHQTSRTSTS